MTNKEELIAIIKRWVDVDREIRELNMKSRVARSQKKELTSELAKIMKENEIDCFDINAGRLTHSVRKTKGSVNKKLLIAALGEYFSDSDTHFGKEDDIAEFILAKRNVKETDVINIRK